MIADTVMPDENETDPLLQYDTYDGSAKTSDWIGYTFPSDRNLSKLILQQGIQSPAGGWFETLDVEVRRNGVWESVTYLSPIKAYEGNNGQNFDSYILLFESKWGDAIRVIGQPGGTDDFVSIAELRVFGLTTPEFVADVRRGTAPLTVQFTICPRFRIPLVRIGILVMVLLVMRRTHRTLIRFQAPTTSR